MNTWDATLPPSIVVVVEGLNDARRVRKALNISHPDAVFAINRGGKKQGIFRQESEHVETRADCRRRGGKEGRMDERRFKTSGGGDIYRPRRRGTTVPAKLHQIFTPGETRVCVSISKCKKETNWHDVNDCGVEFATDGAIRVALKQARTPRAVTNG